MSAIEFSVVVPAYNASESLPACLRALGQQTIPREQYEIIVVSDGSVDNTQEVATREGANRVLVIPHQGPAAARNAGVEAARGRIVLFTDADCEPTAEWIERMVEALQDPDVSGAKGTYRTQQRSLVARFVQLEYEDKYDRMHGRPSIDFVDTYSAAYRRTIFGEGQHFDPAFPQASGEDIEFSYRLAQQGHRLVFAPAAAVFHQHPATVGQYLRRKYYVGFWRVRMYRLHPDKVVEDSHTPQTLKLQVGLAALLPISLLLMALHRAFGLLSAVVLAAFLISSVAFVVKAVRRDPPVATAAPGLLFLRAAALGLGFFSGLAWHLLRTNRPPRGGASGGDA